MSPSSPEQLAIRGRYRGQPLDTSSRHSLRLHDAEAASADGATEVWADYFYHQGMYWTARIPLDGVSHLFGQAFNFSQPKKRKGPDGPEIIYDQAGLPLRRIPCLNHLQTRFKMHDGASVCLYPLGEPTEGEPAHRIRDFVYSIEAVGPLGVGFGVRDGLNGSLVSAHRFVSIDDMVFERCVVENQYVVQSAALPLEASHCRQLLQAALLRSHRAGMTEAYYLYRCGGTNNCTSEPFQLLDRVVPYTIWQRLSTMLFRLPLFPRHYLRLRGMDADPNHRALLRDEFTEFIKDPETQQRKRDYVRARTRELREARRKAAAT